MAKTDLRKIFGKPAHEAFPNIKQKDLQDYVKVAGNKVSHIDDLAPYGDQNVKTTMFKSKIINSYDRYVGLLLSDVTAYMI